MAKRFTLLYKEPGYGMRFFSDVYSPGAIAVADNSGPTPDATDDGVLYVDVDVALTPRRVGNGYYVDMGVITPMGKKFRAGCQVEGALYLMEAIPELECKLSASLQALAKLIDVAKDRQPRDGVSQ